jgi:hypothetical protein
MKKNRFDLIPIVKIIHINLSHFIACEGTKIKSVLSLFDDGLLVSDFPVVVLFVV